MIRRPLHRAERRVTYALKVVLLIALSLYLLGDVLAFIGRIESVAVIIIGAIFFSYLVYPIVRRLNERLSLGWSITIVYAFILTLIALAFSFVVPALIDNFQQLIRDTPHLVHNAQAAIADPHSPLTRWLPPSVRAYLEKTPAQLAELGQKYAGDATSRAFTILLSTFSLIATFIIIPVLAAYMMLEAEMLKRSGVALIPRRIRSRTLTVLGHMEEVLGGFIRGQVIVGATVGTLITIMLLIMHVQYAVLIGVAAGVLDVIPYVGAIAGAIPGVGLALFQDGVSIHSAQHAGLVALGFALIFQAEGHFIAPKIVSQSVGLTPLWVIVAILIGGELLGIAGMFIAVPIAGMIRVIIVDLVPHKASIAEARPELTPQPRDEVPGAAQDKPAVSAKASRRGNA